MTLAWVFPKWGVDLSQLAHIGNFYQQHTFHPLNLLSLTSEFTIHQTMTIILKQIWVLLKVLSMYSIHSS